MIMLGSIRQISAEEFAGVGLVLILGKRRGKPQTRKKEYQPGQEQKHPQGYRIECHRMDRFIPYMYPKIQEDFYILIVCGLPYMIKMWFFHNFRIGF